MFFGRSWLILCSIFCLLAGSRRLPPYPRHPCGRTLFLLSELCKRLLFLSVLCRLPPQAPPRTLRPVPMCHGRSMVRRDLFVRTPVYGLTTISPSSHQDNNSDKAPRRRLDFPGGCCLPTVSATLPDQLRRWRGARAARVCRTMAQGASPQGRSPSDAYIHVVARTSGASPLCAFFPGWIMNSQEKLRGFLFSLPQRKLLFSSLTGYGSVQRSAFSNCRRRMTEHVGQSFASEEQG